jgi:hypothetical protein
MDMWLDKKYIMMMSMTLPLFKEVGENTFNFRCVICGDSKTNPNKTRGYLLEKSGKFFSYCHNCHTSLPFSKFLEQINPTLFEEYLKERLTDTKRTYRKNTKQLKSMKIDDMGIPSLMWLDLDHPAREYTTKRQIPVRWLSRLFYAENFNEFANRHVPGKYDPAVAEPRLVIPLRSRSGKLIGFQGRSLDSNSKLRYITALLARDNPKLFNLDLVDLNIANYALEGPFDAMMLSNAIASCGGSIATEIQKAELNTSNTVVVYDNEPRNKDIVRNMSRAIKAGFKIVIWPSGIIGKDINEMVLGGLQGIENVLQRSTYQGLEAEMQLSIWRK